MCNVPKRNWRSAFQPKRLIAFVAALAAIGAGWQIPNAFGLIPMCLGAVVLLMAILLPAVHDVEFGFPSGVKLSATLQDRAEELRAVFEGQRRDLELCANLICDEPATAAILLEAAWAKTSADWRGPVTPGIRVYTLCVFVNRFMSHTQWVHPQQRTEPQSQEAVPALSPLATLSPNERVVVVLHEFAELSLAEIATLTGSALADVIHLLQHAEASLARSRASGSL
ncbi:MAG: hypothetical protein JWO93_2310 [Micrococcaceae bacterium]|nr:hypothetical protein [Micrococcaceae bacterium]